jgi:hypothetical protein
VSFFILPKIYVNNNYMHRKCKELGREGTMPLFGLNYSFYDNG